KSRPSVSVERSVSTSCTKFRAAPGAAGPARRSHSHIRYSSPGHGDKLAVDFDAPGRVDVHALQQIGVPREADFYLCGPPPFMSDLTAGLAAWDVAPHRVHSEIFGSGPPMTPGIVSDPRRPLH